MFYLVIELSLDIRRIFTVLFLKNDIPPIKYQISFTIVQAPSNFMLLDLS